jgi:hypothetical protein
MLLFLRPVILLTAFVLFASSAGAGTDPCGLNRLTLTLESLRFNDGLISQKDPRFGQAGYLRKEGGLCGPTCIINIVRGVEAETNRTILSGDPVKDLQRIERYLQREGESWDIRDGVSPRHLTNYLRELLTAKPDFGVIDVRSVAPGHAFHFSDLQSSDSAYLLVVYAFNGSTRMEGHVIVLMSTKPSGDLVVIDPNRPDRRMILATSSAIHPVFGTSTLRVAFPSELVRYRDQIQYLDSLIEIRFRPYK